MSTTEIIPHDSHTAEDYIRSGVLHAEAVAVRFTRESKGRYNVEISILDRDYTFADDVANALERAGFRASVTRARDLIVTAPKGFRAPKGFVRVDSL